jgi:hypothetical protein
MPLQLKVDQLDTERGENMLERGGSCCKRVPLAFMFDFSTFLAICFSRCLRLGLEGMLILNQCFYIRPVEPFAYSLA